jgi:diacylglycerol kinase (ATP)
MHGSTWQNKVNCEKSLEREDMAVPRPRRLRESFCCAAKGARYALSTQRNLRIHLMAAGTVLVLGGFLGVGALGLAILATAIGLIIFAELVNTAIEVLVDLVTGEYHPLAEIAKDVAAGAVLVTSGIAVLVGFLILGPPLWHLVVR